MNVTYRVHPQVTLEMVAGRQFLIAYGEALMKLPYLQEINETGAFYWKMVEAGLGEDEMLLASAEVYDAPQERLKKGLRMFLRELEEKGYLFKDIFSE